MSFNNCSHAFLTSFLVTVSFGSKIYDLPSTSNLSRTYATSLATFILSSADGVEATVLLP